MFPFHNICGQRDGGKATAEYATFNSKTKAGTLSGKVIANKEDMHITCEKFIIIDPDHFAATGKAHLTKAGRTVSADRIDYSKPEDFAETSGGSAKLIDNDGSVLTCGKLDYNHKTGIANAYGNVNIKSSARHLTASGEKAIYRAGEGGAIDLYGGEKPATATQDGNTVSGAKLHLTNTNKAVADGNVQIYYVPDQPAVVGKEQETETKA